MQPCRFYTTSYHRCQEENRNGTQGTSLDAKDSVETPSIPRYTGSRQPQSRPLQSLNREEQPRRIATHLSPLAVLRTSPR